MDLISPLAHAPSMGNERAPGTFWWFNNKKSLCNGSLTEFQNSLDFFEVI